MFMTDYNNRKKGPGGFAFVRDYYSKAFQRHPKHMSKFTGLREDQKIAKMEEYRQQYQIWKREEETVVTARNRLFQMYHLVCSYIHCIISRRLICHSSDLLYCLIDGGQLTIWPKRANNLLVF